MRGKSAAKGGLRERGRKLDHRAARSQRDGSAVVGFAHFFFFFYTILEYLRLLSTVLVRRKIQALRAIETGSTNARIQLFILKL